MAMTSWSAVAANNILANTGINCDEGMAPSAVNDSIREIMAVLKTAIDTGNLTVTGTTANIANTVATTVNAFGAASVALNIGHASAAAAFAGGISVPTGKNVTGTGTATVTGFATVSATTLTGTLSTAAQPNVTSVGTLTSLTSSGVISSTAGGGAFKVDAGAGVSKTGYAQFTGTTAASVSQTWYSGINVFATDGSYEVKNGSGSQGFSITPAGATTFIGALTAGAITSNGGLQTFSANDAAGAGFRYVLVPNA